MAQGKITAKQQEILSYIKEQILEKGYPPAVREICEAVHLKSTSSVHSHLETLEKNGFIRRDPTKPRAIEICDDSFQAVRTEMVSLPVIGNVAAGFLGTGLDNKAAEPSQVNVFALGHGFFHDIHERFYGG